VVEVPFRASTRIRFPIFFTRNIGAIRRFLLVFEKNVHPQIPHRTESERLERLLYEQKIDSLAQQLEREKQFSLG
jgi:hypothetical protein